MWSWIRSIPCQKIPHDPFNLSEIIILDGDEWPGGNVLIDGAGMGSDARFWDFDDAARRATRMGAAKMFRDLLFDRPLQSILMDAGIFHVGADLDARFTYHLMGDGTHECLRLDQDFVRVAELARDGGGLQRRPGRAAADLEVRQDRVNHGAADGVQRGSKIQRALYDLADEGVGIIQANDFDFCRHQMLY